MSGGVTSLRPLRLTDNHFTASPSIGDYLDNSNKSPTANVSFQAFDYASYEDRLKSFEDFPHKNVSKEAFAKAGFYYTGRNDLVRCAFCNIEGYQWNAGDDPALDHKTWSPQCRFVMSLSGSNNTRSVDTCGLYGGEILPNSVSENEVPAKNFGKKSEKADPSGQISVRESVEDFRRLAEGDETNAPRFSRGWIVLRWSGRPNHLLPLRWRFKRLDGI